MKKQKKTQFLILYSFCVALFLIFALGPILWSFIMSITPQVEVESNTTNLLPESADFSNYRKLLSGESQQGELFVKGMGNSLLVAVLSLLVGIPVAILGAYSISRLRFRGAIPVRNVLLFTMAIPVFATIIPLYKIFVSFHLMDSFLGLVLVYVTSFLPLTVWLLMGYFSTIPKELEEAAYVDGCSPFNTMIFIILPVSYPIIFAASLIVFLTTWNQFQIPLVLAPSHATKPIAVVVSEFVTKNTMDYGLMNAGGIIALFPPALIAIIFRKFLISGMVGGSTKG